MKTKVLLIVLLVIGSYGIGRAQNSENNTIKFGNKVLRLGMAKDTVLAALVENYSVDENGWVTTKSPYRAEGQVVFKNGKLVSVSKDWSPSNQQHGYELANNIYGLFKDLQNEGITNCDLSTASNQTATGESKTVFLWCGRKKIGISNVRFLKEGETNGYSIVTEDLKTKD